MQTLNRPEIGAVDRTGKCELLRAVRDPAAFRNLLDAHKIGDVPQLLDACNRNCLILSVRENSADVIALLLERFSKNNDFINHKDIVGCTAATYAAELGHTQVLEQLLSAGADASSQDPFGNTPIIWAAKRGRLAALKVFKRFVKSLKVWQVKGEDALDARGWAKKMKHESASELIGKIILELQRATDRGLDTRHKGGSSSGASGGICIPKNRRAFSSSDPLEVEESSPKQKIVQEKTAPIPTTQPEMPSLLTEAGAHPDEVPQPQLHQFELQNPGEMGLRADPEVAHPPPQAAAAGDTAKKALVVFSDFWDPPCRIQAIDEARRTLSLSFRRCGFDVMENSRPTPGNLVTDLDQMMADAGFDDADTRAAAVGILEFCRLDERERSTLLSVVSNRRSLEGLPKWIVDLGFAPTDGPPADRCACLFSNSVGDVDTAGSHLPGELLRSLEPPGALDAGLDEAVLRAVEAVKLATQGRANPRFISQLGPFDLLM